MALFQLIFNPIINGNINLVATGFWLIILGLIITACIEFKNRGKV